MSARLPNGLRPGRDGATIAHQFSGGLAAGTNPPWESRQGRRNLRGLRVQPSLPGLENGNQPGQDPTNKLVGYCRAVPAGTKTMGSHAEIEAMIPLLAHSLLVVGLLPFAAWGQDAP